MKHKYRRGATDEETMAESSREAAACCSPHAFTSALLGVLACVLMTGGVFLAFHRWDPLWLIVSGVGVILVLIGSILHCCRPPHTGKAAAGCCHLPDHLHNHVVLNGGSLTEQLLPLSNARSVSQLSLNMLPGYFPPMVTTYGIEQHSAVVQNINRIIQQQAASQSPAPVGSPGKNFILLSLPGNTPQANIQNLVATVYQLDGSVSETSSTAEVPPSTASASPPATTSPPVQAHIPILKNAEVQTCAAWPVPNSAKPASTSATPPTTSNEQTSSPISTQTDDAINLMDCSTTCDTQNNSVSVEVDIPEVLVDVSDGRVSVPDVNRTSILENTTLLEIVPQVAAEPSEVLVDISETLSSVQTSPVESTSETVTDSPTRIDESSVAPATSTGDVVASTSSTDSSTPESSNDNLDCVVASASVDVFQNDHSESSSLSLADTDSMGRSSPPPSYDDVATPAGVFGLAYGTL